MKITILIACIENLKSNKTWKFDISDCQSLLTVYLKTCSKCLLPAFTQTWSLDKAQYGFVDGVLW